MDVPTYLIYGLIDPRSRLIRYVGLSSSGLQRPKAHRRRSCPDSYCRRWVRSLQSLGLDYEIVVLEVVDNVSRLDKAERWWIAFGLALGWPLTNCMLGGYPSKESLLKRQLKKKALEDADAARIKSRYSIEQVNKRNRYLKKQYGIPKEIERRCIKFFSEHVVRGEDVIDDTVVAVCVTRETAARLYVQWYNSRNPDNPLSLIIEDSEEAKEVADLKKRAFDLFSAGHALEAIVSALRVTPEEIERLYALWRGASSS